MSDVIVVGGEPKVAKKRGRPAKAITSDEMGEAIFVLENEQPEGKFASRSALWAAVAESDFGRKWGLSPQMAMVYFNKLNEENPDCICPSTVPAEKGLRKGHKIARKGKGKRAKHRDVSAIRASVPEQYQKLVEKVEKGSRNAAIKLRCLDCSNWQKKEITLCTVKECGLYPFRPYQRFDTQNQVYSDGVLIKAPSESETRIPLEVLTNDGESTD